MENKNSKQLDSFIKYCEENPNLRFWQALRNWSGKAFILKANDELITSILVPPGFLNGHLVLSDNAVFHYKWALYCHIHYGRVKLYQASYS